MQKTRARDLGRPFAGKTVLLNAITSVDRERAAVATIDTAKLESCFDL